MDGVANGLCGWLGVLLIAAFGSLATGTDAAHAWTKGEPAPEIAGFTLVGASAQGYPEYDKDLGQDVSMRFVLVPAGTFQMGSATDDPAAFPGERPQHTVTVDAFLMAKTECTQGQWQAVMGDNPSHFKSVGLDAPVEQVSWDKIQWFEKKSGLTLPSEAQWEYACRAGTTGSHHGELDAIAWHNGNPGGTTHPVAQKQANAFGLHDMSGNVWEWCEDTSGSYADAPVDGRPRLDADPPHIRIRRGGCHFSTAKFCRSAYRTDAPAFNGNYSRGFRAASLLRSARS